ncbi:MAG: tetratricopeptide repeat protein [Tunicatimonas sp.]
MTIRTGIVLLSMLFTGYATIGQTPEAEDDIVDIQVNSMEELAARGQAEDLNNEGYALLEAEQYAAAEPYFQRALTVDSTNVAYYENLARALGGQQRTAAVAALYARAQRQFPEDADFHYYRGDALQKLKRYEEARQEYDRAIAVSQQHPGTQLQHLYHFNRGNTCLKQRNYAAARHDYDEALRINEYHYASYANRGFARYNLKDQAGACADWQRAKEAGYSAAQNYLSKYCQ